MRSRGGPRAKLVAILVGRATSGKAAAGVLAVSWGGLTGEYALELRPTTDSCSWVSCCP